MARRQHDRRDEQQQHEPGHEPPHDLVAPHLERKQAEAERVEHFGRTRHRGHAANHSAQLAAVFLARILDVPIDAAHTGHP